ncbi:delphilin [Poecilia formosa]|uniref:delphilin n=1 Tax=Poecilia formosa TaxID=48698 RepID=UPI0007B8FCD0|nr:PREDICTED: delphilin-like [Poecilia formosa]
MKKFLQNKKGRYSFRQSRRGPRCPSKDFFLSMPASNQGWPEDFGFQLGGSGPSYILWVEEGSSAHLAGLQAGDQVLEIEGHNVSTLAPQAVIAIAQTQKNIPPSIGVVSRIQQMDIVPGPDSRFGFTIVGDCPLLVEDCSPCSPAGRAGLRAGDFVMEVNGIPVRHHEMAAALIKASQGQTLRLGVLSLGPHHKRSTSLEDGPAGGEWARLDRKHKALEFNMKVEQLLGEAPEVKEKLFSVLKQYAAEKKVEWLASALPEVLTTAEQRQLISSIRIFVPKKHRQRFDEAVSQNVINRLCRSKSISEPQGRMRRSRSEDQSDRRHGSKRASSVPRDGGEPERERGARKAGGPAHPPLGPNQRVIRVYRGKKSFGFTLRGHAPVCIDAVIPGTASNSASGSDQNPGGIRTGWFSFINDSEQNLLFVLLAAVRLSLNSNSCFSSAPTGTRPDSRCHLAAMSSILSSCRSCSHEKVVSMLQGSGAVPTLVVEDGPSDFSSDQTDPEESPSLAPAMVPRSRSPALSSLQWVAEILPPSIKVQGRTFSQQLDHLLTIQERYTVCKALETFFQHRNLDSLIVDVFPVLDTPAKQLIWQFIHQLLTYDEQERCQSKLSRFLGFKSSALLDPDGAPEHHKRSSSMRVTGSSYRSCVRERSSDDCIIGTHLGMGIHVDECGSPEERQSGDGTSFPESPDLSHMTGVYTELENLYAGKNVSPAEPEAAGQTEAYGRSLSPLTLPPLTGSRKSGLSLSWKEPLPSAVYQVQHQSSVESNPYVSLESPPASPPPPRPTSGPNTLTRRRKLFTFSRPPRSRDTDKFLDALSEQLGHRVTLVDDNDYEEIDEGGCHGYRGRGLSMSFPEEVGVAFRPRRLSSGSSAERSSSSGDEDVPSPSSSSGSEPIPPPPDHCDWNRSVCFQLRENSDYDKLSDMVKYLDLDLHFGTQRRPISPTEPAFLPENLKKKDVVEILSHKKAYNASILMAHLKLSPDELRQVLLDLSTDRLEPAHIKQLLLYAPDQDEVQQYQRFQQDPAKLSEPDQFIFQMLTVPEYKTRLRGLLFKTTLQERAEEMKAAFDYIYKASVELKSSRKLAKILEFVLAMGNYLNNGQPKSHRTTSFKINFLTELSTTKTVDGKSTFLHILAKSLSQHFPELLSFPRELLTVPLAAKVNQRAVTTELSELHAAAQDIRTACQKLPASADDHFASVMSSFLENSHPALQSLESLQSRAMAEFSKVASFFGEDSQSTSTDSFFGIFAEFMSKFERALSETQSPENPRSPRLSSPLAW